jgi:hypothetical protein
MCASLHDQDILLDVLKCIKFLSNLEQRWSGASRSRVIIEQLLDSYRNRRSRDGVAPGVQDPTATGRPSNANKRKLNDIDLDHALFDGDNTHWQQASNWELFGFDLMAFDSL